MGEGWPGDNDCEPLFMALRCEEDRTARSAALAGSSGCSIKDLSWPDCRLNVGEAFLGVDSRKSFFVENFRESPPDWLEDGVGAGGDIVLLLS